MGAAEDKLFGFTSPGVEGTISSELSFAKEREIYLFKDLLKTVLSRNNKIKRMLNVALKYT